MFQVREFPFLRGSFSFPGHGELLEFFSRDARKILVHGEFGIKGIIRVLRFSFSILYFPSIGSAVKPGKHFMGN